MRLTIGWLWILGTGVVVVDCGGQTTLTVDQPQSSRDAGDLDGSIPVNTDAADADAALMCVGWPGYFDVATVCIDGEMCVHACGGAPCRRIPAGCVIGSQACADQVCGAVAGTWSNDREVICETLCPLGSFRRHRP